MKSISFLLGIILTSLAFAQTSSLYRNRIIQSATDYQKKADTYCEAYATREYEAQTELLYKYRGSFLNNCLNTFKMTLMDKHETSLKKRIKFFEEAYSHHPKAQLKRDIEGLKTGLATYQEKKAHEAGRFTRSVYYHRSLKETPVNLRRHIYQIGLEYYELRTEMAVEGSL
jgi:hypothetical protein